MKSFSIPVQWLNLNTIFLSLVLEAIPFILLGVFVSALLQVFVSDATLQRFIPNNPWLALLPAVFMGAVLPVCECAIIPVVRRLILKGMPLHVGVVLLVSAPILNPVVFASTFFAFRNDIQVLYARMGLTFVLALVIGALLFLIFKNALPVKEKYYSSASNGQRSFFQKTKETFQHAVEEFFDMGKYLIMGAFIASIFQTFLNREVLYSIGSNEWSSTMVMMAFAYVISLCSEADAFVAASFGSTFTFGSIVAFLIYGPMLDLKNTFVLFAYFKPRFVLTFMGIVTCVVFGAVMILEYIS